MGRRESLPLLVLTLGYWIILKDPGFISRHHCIQKVWRFAIFFFKFVLHSSTPFCFRSSVSERGTIRELLPNHSVEIFLTVSLSMFNCCAISRMLIRRSWRTISQFFSTFPSVVEVGGLPVVADIFPPLPEPSVPFAHMRLTHCFITVHFP
jgi:hypothetical protein